MNHKRLKVDIMSKPASMEDLPVEVLAQIFSLYVLSEGNAKLCSVLGQVSTLWHEVTLKPSFWEEVTFTAEDFSQGYPWLEDPRVLKRLALAKTLNLRCGRFVVYSLPQALEIILKNSPNLESFTFEYNRGLKIPYFMFDLSTICPKITQIQSRNVSSFASDNVFFNWIETFSVNLTKLSIRQFLGDVGSLTVLSQKIATFCPNMTHLELDMVSSNEFLDLNALQAGCLKMRELCLKNLAFTDNDDQVSCFLQLQKFCFKPFPVTFYNSKVQHGVVRALRGSKELKELTLIDVNPSTETMLRLPCEYLERLQFQYYSVHASGLYVVLCQWKHSLTALNVSCSDNSQEFLFQYLEEYGNADMLSLALRSFSIQVERLKQIIRQCAKLEYLSFEAIPNSSEHNIFPTRKEIIEWLNQ